MRTEADWARPPEYCVLDDEQQVMLRDDQVVCLNRVLLRGRLQTYLRAMRGRLWWHVFDLRDVLARSPCVHELEVQLSDQTPQDQRGIVFYGLRLSFATLGACTDAIGRASVVVPLDAQLPAAEPAPR
jgi:hypothetical protein